MRSKKISIVCIILFLTILPIIIKASSLLSSYGETVTKANNYITSYRDRRKYLIFNKNYVYERTGFGDSSSFTNGGLLSKSEFDLSIINNQSYLANGKEYWTLTSDGANKYYVDAYIQSKGINSLSGTRVTEFIKPGTLYSGRGTYSNPWVFDEGYSVDVISNNTDYGEVSPLGERYVRPGATLSYVLTPKNGYYYNRQKDECNLEKDGTNPYENNYLIKDINKDIECTAVFELQTYRFDLNIKDSDKDYNNVKKVYATSPNPNPIYYKYKTNWYSDEKTKNVISKITKPVVTGWTFNGYYYGSTQVIDSDGKLTNTAKYLNLGTTKDFVDIVHSLEASLTKNTYTVSFTMNGGKLGGNASPSNITAKYDEVVSIDNPTKAGYSFEGWTFNGNTSTAIHGSSKWTSTSTKVKDTSFVNLTPTVNATVKLTANWLECPAGTYNDGTKTTCTKCPAGTYSSGTGNSACTPCANGSYSTTEGSISCTKCVAGKYGLGEGKSTEATACKNCANGSYSTTEGSTSCTKCAAGKYGLGEGKSTEATACKNCANGSYSTTEGSTGCTKCAAGKYGLGEGKSTEATACKNCPSGSYSTTSGSTSCTKCVAGKYGLGEGKSTEATACKNCAKGSYSATPGLASCTSCPASYPDTANEASTSKTQCRVLNNCSTTDCNHDSCTVSGSYQSSRTGTCWCTEPGFPDSNHGSCTSDGNCSTNCYVSIGPESDGDCKFPYATCQKNDANHTNCKCTGTYYSYSPA